MSYELDCDTHGKLPWDGQVICAPDLGGCGRPWHLGDAAHPLYPPEELGKNCACGASMDSDDDRSPIRAICPHCFDDLVKPHLEGTVSMMRRFHLVRSEDASGVSGIGIVAQGVQFTDGTVALRWLTATRSTAIYESIEHVEAIHGHDGKTKIVFFFSDPEHSMTTQKIYLAARYSRREELRGYRQQLQELGYEVTSRWLDGTHEINDDGTSREGPFEQRQRFAQEDWADLIAASVVITFTEPPRSTASRGGRHVEFGAALALNKTCVVIGPRENVFHCMPKVVQFHSWEAVQTFLRPPKETS